MQKSYFLDANSSVPVLNTAAQTCMRLLKIKGNASSAHAAGRLLRHELDIARKEVCSALSKTATSKDLYFTSGASEANRWLVDSIVLWGKQHRKTPLVFMSPFEHPSLYKALEIAALTSQIELEILSFAPNMQLITLKTGVQKTALQKADFICCTTAHNETGLLIDWLHIDQQLSSTCIRISDVSQALARIATPPSCLDIIVASAHKIGGICGAGAFLLQNRAAEMPTPWAGGGQEKGRRPGTEAVAIIAAFGAACKEINTTRSQHRALKELRDWLEQEIITNIPNATIVGKNNPRLPQTSAITFANIAPDAMRMGLDMAGLNVGFGSACSALAPEDSPALRALGLSSKDSRATVRISLDTDWTFPELKEAISIFIQTIKLLDTSQI